MSENRSRLAAVTGASSGIGAATAGPWPGQASRWPLAPGGWRGSRSWP